MKRVGDLGEFGLVERIRRVAGPAGRDWVIGIGDDAAVLRPRSGEDLVVTSDALVEGVHFRWTTSAATTVGRHALAVNLSDAAAMGARPLGFTLCAALPPAFALARFDAVLRGLVSEARRFACPLVGGNLSRAREASFAITLLGAVPRGQALRRHTSRAGDPLYVTGSFGGAALAVRRAGSGGARIRTAPTPRVEAGRALGRLARRGAVGACIDVSDGLVADLGHLLEGTSLGAEIDAGRVPRPRGFEATCRRLGVDPDALVFGGGEDYELLFGLRADVGLSEAALSRRLGVRVTRIGTVTRRPGLRGLPELGRSGWQHF